LGTESLRTYNKIEPSSYSIKDRIIQIIGFSALLLWLVVYAIKTINFNEYVKEYDVGSLINDGSLIKAILFLAAFSFTVSILLGMWTHYKIKRAYPNDQSKWIIKLVNWFTLGFFVLMMSIPFILFPESDRFFEIYSIALLYAGKHVRDKMLKKMATEYERTCM